MRLYVEGLTLADLLAKKGPLPILHACHYARQAALGLSLYDLAAVMAALARHGVDLTGLWDDAAYQAAVRADARTWLCAQRDVMGAARLDLTLAAEALAQAGVPVDV